MLPEKLDCFPIFPSSSLDLVSEMPSSNSIWQLRRLNCFSDAGTLLLELVEVESQWSLCVWDTKGFSLWDLSRNLAPSLHPNATYAELLPKRTDDSSPLPSLPPCSISPSPPSSAPKCQGASLVGVTGVTGVVALTVSLCLVHIAPDPRVGREGSERRGEPLIFSSRLGLLWSRDKLRVCGGWCGWEWTGEVPQLCLVFLLDLDEEVPDRWTPSLPPKPPMLPPLLGEGNGESNEPGLSRIGDWEQTPLEVPVPGLSSLHSLGMSSEWVGAMLGQCGLFGE